MKKTITLILLLILMQQLALSENTKKQFLPNNSITLLNEGHVRSINKPWDNYGDGYYIGSSDLYTAHKTTLFECPTIGYATNADHSYVVFCNTITISSLNSFKVIFAGKASGQTGVEAIDINLSTNGSEWTLLGTTKEHDWLGYKEEVVSGTPNISGNFLYTKVSPHSEPLTAAIYIEKVNIEIEGQLSHIKNGLKEIRKTQITETSFCESIDNLLPVKPNKEFKANIGKVYFWTNIYGTEKPTIIKHVWYYKNKKVAEVPLKVEYIRHRTWSSKIIEPVWAGDWTVEVIDKYGNLIQKFSFIIN